jgi:hypothetical protein
MLKILNHYYVIRGQSASIPLKENIELNLLFENICQKTITLRPIKFEAEYEGRNQRGTWTRIRTKQ